jgi:hypothetical protein
MSVGYSDKITSLLQKIATDYDLDVDELKQRYLTESLLIDTVVDIKPIESSSLICMARKQDGSQCTRRKKQECEYCGKHVTNRRYGRIDENCMFESSNFIQTHIESFNNTNYLVDENDIVFTYNVNKPSVVGYKQMGELVLA